MSQFASGQADTLTSLSRLAQKAGEGQAFNTRFQQGRQLQQDVERRRQVDAQAQQATQDRQVRLQQLAFEQESTRIQQANAQARKEADAQRAEREQSTADRQRDLANQFKERDLARMEGELGVRQQAEGRKQEAATGTQLPPAPGSKEANKIQRQLVDELSDLSKVLDPLNGPDLDDETRLSITNRRDQINQSLVDLQQTTKAAALNASRTAQARQTTRAVTQKEAGPILEQTLEAAGQSRVLELPISSDTGRTDTAQLKPGKIYQTSRGPALRVGNNAWELIDEIGDVEATLQANQPTKPAARTQPGGSTDFSGPLPVVFQ
jgi:hypothetical protein